MFRKFARTKQPVELSYVTVSMPNVVIRPLHSEPRWVHAAFAATLQCAPSESTTYQRKTLEPLEQQFDLPPFTVQFQNLSSRTSEASRED
jgi:hypothetical protein